MESLIPRVLGLRNEARAMHALERTVQRAGTHRDASPGEILDLPSDRVAVPGPVREGHEQMECRWRERE